jgi:hypothetical protein
VPSEFAFHSFSDAIRPSEAAWRVGRASVPPCLCGSPFFSSPLGVLGVLAFAFGCAARPAARLQFPALARRLFNLVTVLSLLLCVVVCVLWVRSRFATDQQAWAAQTEDDDTPDGMSPRPRSDLPVRLSACTAAQARGVLSVWFARYRLTPPHGIDHVQLMWDFERLRSHERWIRRPPQDFRVSSDDSCLSRLGFGGSARSADESGKNGFEAGFRAPHWFVLLVFAVLPSTRLGRSVRRRARGGRGLCRACGYDLRATPGRCPECGTQPTPDAVKCERQDAKDAKLGRAGGGEGRWRID